MAKPTIANKLLQQQEKCFFSFNLFSILFYFILSFKKKLGLAWAFVF
jgi:hypothetical protein